MRTKTVRKSTLITLLIATLFSALLILGGGYAFSARAVEGDTEPTEPTFGIASVGVNAEKDAENVRAYLVFTETPELTATDLLSLDAYKGKIIVNEKTPLEDITGAAINYGQYNLGTVKKPVNKYALEIVIPKTALHWSVIGATSYPFKIANINRLDIKAGLGIPVSDGSAVSETQRLTEDAILYSSRDEFVLGTEKYKDTAADGAIEYVVIDDVSNKHEVRIKFKTADGAGYIFDETVAFNDVMHGAPATVNKNKFEASILDGHADATELATALGLRYNLGQYITIDGKSLLDVLNAPALAAYEAGLTSDADLIGFCKAIKSYDRIRVDLKGDTMYIKFPIGSNSYTYNPAVAEGEDPKEPVTVTWDAPDPDGDLEIKILPGFCGRKFKSTKGSVATYNGKWTYDDRAMPDLKELKVTRVYAPEFTDGDWMNFKIGFQFNADDAFSGDKTYYTAGYEWMKNTDLGHQRFDENDLLYAGQYRMLETVGDKVVLGGVFGEDTEFKTRTINEMLAEATAADPATYGIIGKDNAVVLHMAPTDIRIVVGGYTSAAQEAKHIFAVKDRFQNFTLTFKAGFRTTGGYEIKQDQNFIFDTDTMQWYEGKTVADIYAAQAKPVIDEIDELPAVDALTLADKARVQAARQSYEDIVEEAQALVTNYEKLTAAEAKIAALEAGGDKPNPDKPDPDKPNTGDEKTDGGKKGCGSDLGAVSLGGGILLLAAACFAATRRRKEVK